MGRYLLGKKDLEKMLNEIFKVFNEQVTVTNDFQETLCNFGFRYRKGKFAFTGYKYYLNKNKSEE